MPPKMKRRAGKVNAERDKNLEIPEDEQWRIVEQSGVLRRASTKTQADRISSPNISSSEPTNETGEELSEDDPNYFCDEIFNSILMIIPFSFLLLLMDVLAHRQYGRVLTYTEAMERLSTGVPILSLFIFYTTRYKATRSVQIALFSVSLFIGPRLIYTINKLSWLTVMRQCPPLATLWICTIVQLDLLPATVSLILVAAWVWYTGQKIIL